ncbi:MAG: fibronectin type III domain-containing protein [Ignavibacteria bacterium]|nr:fibronectin type III domain-containing protein [Ignavibacteria bacterium]
MDKNILKVLPISIILAALAFNTGCVESLTDTQKTGNPTIEVTSPATGDTIMIGDTKVSYQAAEGANGTGLSFYEVYVNNIYVKRFEQNTDGTNPNIFITLDSTYIGSRINYKIKVYSKSGKSKESDLKQNILVKDRPPKSPGNLFLAKFFDFTVSLLWDDSSKNEKGFELWRKDDAGGTYRKIKNLPPNSISTTDGGLSEFVVYFYKLRAYNDSGFSTFSNEVNTSNLPGGPWNLRAEAIGSSLIRLKWTDFAVNEVGFEIQRTDGSFGQFKRIAIVAPNSEEYEDTNVQPSTGYRYRVAYFTNTSFSGYSNEVSIATYYTDVQAPSNLVAVYNSFSKRIELTWEDNTNLEKEVIVERKEDNGLFVEYGKLAADTKAAYDYSIFSGRKYTYRVRQLLSARTYTHYSNQVSVTVP